MHSCPFETGFDDVFVGTLHHTRTNRPPIALELRVLHERFSFAQVIQVLVDSFLLGKLGPQAVSHVQQGSGTSMFENMQTAVEHLWRKMDFGFLQGFQQIGDMLSPMRKI